MRIGCLNRRILKKDISREDTRKQREELHLLESQQPRKDEAMPEFPPEVVGAQSLWYL
jgi:hypothetical protein